MNKRQGFTLIELPKAVLRKGFTLVELLVVITIVVVLLALLAPAMDQAIYQAELAVCGTKLHGIASGALTYAFDYKRAFPSRLPIPPEGVAKRPIELRADFRLAPTVSYDERPIIRDYININGHLNCPLAAEVDLTTGDSTATAGSPGYVNYGIFTNYSLWYGWGYVGRPAMARIGDRFEWKGDRFNLLASDLDAIVAGADIQTSHPDSDGLLANVPYQDEPAFGGKLTVSIWQGAAGTRGTIDRNFADQDGSVRRVTDLRFKDPRMTEVPEQRTAADPLWTTYLPKE